MAAKRPRIENGLKEPPPKQFFAPYPEEDDEEDEKELGGSNEDLSSDPNNVNEIVASPDDKRDESKVGVIKRSDEEEISGERQLHVCIVCDRHCISTESIPFTTDQHRRTRWVNSVRWTSEGRRSLMEQLIAIDSPILCASHFLPTDFNHDSSLDLRPDAVPLFIGSSNPSGKDMNAQIEVQSGVKKELVQMEQPIEELANIEYEDPIDDVGMIEHEVAMGFIKSYTCPECDKKLGNKHSFTAHMQVHAGPLPSGSVLGGHITSAHRKSDPNIKTYSCSECGKTLSRKQKDDHMRIHTGEKPFKCPHCNIFFHSLSARSNHVKSKHRTQMCSPPIGTSRPIDQSSPIEMINSDGGRKLFVCAECGKNFVSRNGLEYHILTHAGQKPFPCHFCTSTFRSLSDRNSHIRNVHKKQPYACLTCGEEFIDSMGLRVHLFKNEGHVENEYRLEVNEMSHMEEELVEEEPNDDEPGPSRRC